MSCLFDFSTSEILRLAGTLCTHPKVIFRNGQKLLVSCGKCPSCLSQKGALKTRQVLKEMDSNKYCVFITLTYAPEYVPMMWYEKTDEHYNFYDSITNEPIISSKITHRELKSLVKRCDLGGYLPYIRRTDLPKFLKRFRKYLYKYVTTHFYLKNSALPYVRFYALSEYGCKKLRPHHHILLFFDSSEILAVIRQVLYKAWQFGICDLQYVNNAKQCSKYVAQYINGAVDVPFLFTHRSICAKNTHSTHLGHEVYITLYDAYKNRDWNKFLNIPYQYSKETSVVRLWLQVKSYFFRKPFRFSEIPIDMSVRVAGLYKTLKLRYNIDEIGISKVVHQIYNQIYNFNYHELKNLLPWSCGQNSEELLEDLPNEAVYLQRVYTSRHIAFMCDYFHIDILSYLDRINDFEGYDEYHQLVTNLKLAEKCNDSMVPLALYQNTYVDEKVYYGQICWDTYELRQILSNTDFANRIKDLSLSMQLHIIKHRMLNAENIPNLQ